jgi:hypothetical protein
MNRGEKSFSALSRARSAIARASASCALALTPPRPPVYLSATQPALLQPDLNL